MTEMKADNLFKEFLIMGMPIYDLAEEYDTSCANVYNTLCKYKLLKENHETNQHSDVLPIRTCGYCGKAFVMTPNWAYRTEIKGKVIYCCRYNCMQAFRKDYKLKGKIKK